MPNSEHLSRQFDADLEGLRSRVLQMGGLVESQILSAIEGFNTGNLELIDQVIAGDRRVNGYEVSIDPETLPERSRSGGFGLPGMRARAERIAGCLAVESEPGRGTALSARVPLVRHEP